MNKTLELFVVTPEKVLFQQQANEVILNTASGQITILPEHSSLITKLVPGDIVVKNGQDKDVAILHGGVAVVDVDNKLTILADSADLLSEVDESLVEKAIGEAQEYKKRMLGNSSASAENNQQLLAETQAELLKNMTRLRVARKHRSKKGISYND